MDLKSRVESKRKEHRHLGGVREARVVGDGSRRDVYARRYGFTQQTLDAFPGLIVDQPQARFRVWGWDEETLPVGVGLHFSDADRWRIVGATALTVEGELYAYDVMVARNTTR